MLIQSNYQWIGHSYNISDNVKSPFWNALLTDFPFPVISHKTPISPSIFHISGHIHTYAAPLELYKFPLSNCISMFQFLAISRKTSSLTMFWTKCGHFIFISTCFPYMVNYKGGNLVIRVEVLRETEAETERNSKLLLIHLTPHLQTVFPSLQ